MAKEIENSLPDLELPEEEKKDRRDKEKEKEIDDEEVIQEKKHSMSIKKKEKVKKKFLEKPIKIVKKEIKKPKPKKKKEKKVGKDIGGKKGFSIPKKPRKPIKGKIIVKKVKQKKFKLKKERDIALDFAAQVHKRFDTIVKATVLFGSQAREQVKSGSDIDIVIIIDDAGINWDLELVSWYREELAKLVAANQYGNDLHINTIRLTTWWNDLMHGDPVIMNILRYGETLIDIGGFFKPLKSLLLQGKIHSTPEAVHAALQRAPMHLARSQFAELNAIEGIYWTMVDSAQAALITLGKLPPSPEHITGMLKEHFVDQNLLKMDYVRWYRDIFILHKGVIHGSVRGIRGAELDEWQERAGRFLKQMTQIIDKLIEARRKE